MNIYFLLFGSIFIIGVGVCFFLDKRKEKESELRHQKLKNESLIIKRKVEDNLLYSVLKQTVQKISIESIAKSIDYKNGGLGGIIEMDVYSFTYNGINYSVSTEYIKADSVIILDELRSLYNDYTCGYGIACHRIFTIIEERIYEYNQNLTKIKNNSKQEEVLRSLLAAETVSVNKNIFPIETNIDKRNHLKLVK